MPRKLHRRSWLMVVGVAALLFACVSPAAPAQHHVKHVEHEQIGALEQQWRKAQLDDDVSAMDKLLSDDYLGITAAGEVVTKAQQLDRMRSREISLTRLDISDVKVKLVGRSVAIVNSMATIEGESDKHPITGSYRYTRVYQRLPNGAWKITSFEPTRIVARNQHVAATTPSP